MFKVEGRGGVKILWRSRFGVLRGGVKGGYIGVESVDKLSLIGYYFKDVGFCCLSKIRSLLESF